MPSLKERIQRMSIKMLIRNIYHLFVTGITDNSINDIRFHNQKIVNEMLLYFIQNNKWEYAEELKCFIENGYTNFPYNKNRKFVDATGSFDKDLGLPYVNHKGKKLYFSKDYTLENALSFYTSYIDLECLLGGDYMPKKPHQYQTETFCVEDGDVLVDVGCAEALLTLDVIDKVSHAYLFEGDSKWIPALNATFAPYKDKVTIINKYVTDTDSDSTIKLSTALQKESGKSMFIKMDIEGFELSVLNSSVDLFSGNSNIKCACCTYHKNGDESRIKSYFDDLGYDVEFSDGVMFYDAYDKPEAPFFRKGLLRAKKQ